MLETDDHAITMVFESRLTAGERKPAILRFDFQWPAALVDPVTRACRGRVRMTLVYDAPVDQAFGTECVRINLSTHLRQRQPADRGRHAKLPRSSLASFLAAYWRLTIPERSLIEHGLKWWPTKRYEADFSGGVGYSAEWRLEVESVVRAEATFPAEGVPFSLILRWKTISEAHQFSKASGKRFWRGGSTCRTSVRPSVFVHGRRFNGA